MSINHKGLKKGVAGMEFENYSSRINSVNETESFGHAINEKHLQFRFSVKKMKWCLSKLKNPNLHK